MSEAERVCVVGGGPAGLEAALTLGRRGYQVSLADKARDFGGRLLWETRLPGLADHRVLPASHTGMIFSSEVAALAAGFLRDGRFPG